MRVHQALIHRVATPGVAQAGWLVVALLLSAAGSACGDQELAPYDGCPGRLASPEAYAPAVRTVQADLEYMVHVEFPKHPCIQTISHCAQLQDLQVCPYVEKVQGSCVPWLTLLEGPAGADVLGTAVWWKTAPADVGRSALFRVRPNYPEGCVEPEVAWTVTVLSAAP